MAEPPRKRRQVVAERRYSNPTQPSGKTPRGKPGRRAPVRRGNAVTRGVSGFIRLIWRAIFGTIWATVLTVVMNKQKYDGLPADLKAIIDKTTGEVMVAKFGEVFDDEANKARQKIAALGNKTTNLTPEEISAMKKATINVEDEWAKQVTEKGLDGKKLLANARQLTGTAK